MPILKQPADHSATPELSFLGAAKRHMSPPTCTSRLSRVQELQQCHSVLKARNAVFQSAWDDLHIGQDPRLWKRFPKLRESTEASLRECTRFAALIEDFIPVCLQSEAEMGMLRDKLEKSQKEAQELRATVQVQREQLERATRDSRAVGEENEKLQKAQVESDRNAGTLQDRLARAQNGLRKAKEDMLKMEQDTLRLRKSETSCAEAMERQRVRLSQAESNSLRMRNENQNLRDKRDQARKDTAVALNRLADARKENHELLRHADKANRATEDPRHRSEYLQRCNARLERTVSRIESQRKALLDEAKMTKGRNEQLQHDRNQLVQARDAIANLQAQSLELKYEITRLEQNEYLSAVRSTEHESIAQQLNQQFGFTRIQLDQAIKEASAVKWMNSALIVERDDARDLAVHWLRVARARFLTMQRLSYHIGFVMPGEGVRAMEEPPAGDLPPQIRRIVSDISESPNGKSWQTPSAILFEHGHVHSTTTQPQSNDEQQTRDVQFSPHIAANLPEREEEKEHRSTTDGLPASIELCAQSSNQAVATSTRRPPKHPRSWHEQPGRPVKRFSMAGAGWDGRLYDSYRPSY